MKAFLGLANARLPTLGAAPLLLLSGTLVGLGFPMAKLAANAGIPPLSWAALTSLGAVLVLLPSLLLGGRLRRPRGQRLRYCLIAGPLSFAAPNLLVVISVAHSGAAYTGLMFALSPLFTLAIAALLKQRSTSALGLLGMLIGMLGALAVGVSRAAGVDAPTAAYLLLALCIPLLLALGNIYRSWDWPQGAAADDLALWSHSFACLAYAALLYMVGEGAALQSLWQSPSLSVSQLLLAAATAPLVFRLQQRGGPLLLSQLGYVAASVSMLVAAVALGEQYSATAWMGAATIALGIALSSGAARHG